MNDDELTRLFRSLDEPAEPRAAFADTLFADLERMTSGAVARRRTSVRWLLLAATLLLVASLGALAIGSGLIKLPFVVDVVSPTPSASATPLGSGTPAPSASASAAPTAVPVVIPEGTSIDRLIAIPDGFLAIAAAPGANPPSSAVSVVLRGTSDGSSWQSIDATRFGTVMDMAVGPSAWVLVANTRPDLSGNWVVWRSTDGKDWTSNPTWTADTITSWLAVTAGPSGFAITGSYSIGPGRSNSTVWTSPDGVRWTRATTATCPSNLSCGWVDSAVILDKGFIAYESGIDGNDVHVFASLDGATWEPISSPTGGGHSVIAGLLQLGSKLVAVTCNPMCNVSTGSLEGSAGSLAIQWQADEAATQQLGGYRPTAITGAGSSGFIFGFDLATYARVVMSSNDGLSWTRTTLAADAFGGGLPTLLAAGQSAVVGVGWTDTTGAGIGRDLWRSPDGTTWSLASAPLVPPAPQVPDGACPPAPTTVQQLADVGFVKAAACYGNQSLTLQGYSSGCGGCGGIPAALLTPDWMSAAYSYGAWYISPQNTKTTPDGTRLAVNLLPAADLTPPGEGVPVTVTGHFNDPASQDCRIVPNLSSELPPTAEAIGLCQRSFMVTSISVTGA
jgi:hypothetical protein